MDLGPLRALALDLNVSAHGVDIVVTRPSPDDTPIETRGIWLTPLQTESPFGTDLQRQEGRRVMAVRKADVPTLPLKTRIEAAEISGAAVQRWRVTGFLSHEADHVRVLLIPDPIE